MSGAAASRRDDVAAELGEFSGEDALPAGEVEDAGAPGFGCWGVPFSGFAFGVFVEVEAAGAYPG